MMQQTSSSEPFGRVLRFPAHRGTVSRPGLHARKQVDAPSPVEDISEYEQKGLDADDYRHRMLVNGLGLAISVVLIASGIWIANSMASFRKDQDCVLAGRRNCAQISIVGNVLR
jgi:hypothetical protein